MTSSMLANIKTDDDEYVIYDCGDYIKIRGYHLTVDGIPSRRYTSDFAESSVVGRQMIDLIEDFSEEGLHWTYEASAIEFRPETCESCWLKYGNIHHQHILSPNCVVVSSEEKPL